MKTHAAVRRTLKQIRKETKSEGPSLVCEGETWIREKEVSGNKRG
jgi:hypothetical protein